MSKTFALCCLLLSGSGIPFLGAQETLHLKALDGQPLVATFGAPEGKVKGGVLLLHMYRTSRRSFDTFLPLLKAGGFFALALDLRGHGGSSRDARGTSISIDRATARNPQESPFRRMSLDARAGLAELAKRGAPADRLAILGAGLGASVALRAAAELRKKVAAVVLMTPDLEALGMPMAEDASRYGQRPLLILSAREDAELGASRLPALLKSRQVTVKLFAQSHIRGSAMFGAVPAVEALIITWLERVLVGQQILEIPYDHGILLDGEFEPDEAPLARRIPVPLKRGRVGIIRLCHDGTGLQVGFLLHERCMRRNGVELFLNAGGSGPDLPDATCYRILLAPHDQAHQDVRLFRGDQGHWQEMPARGVLAQAAAEGRKMWSAEIRIQVKELLGKIEKPLRLAFRIKGAVSSDIHAYPDNKNLERAPRTWIKAHLLPRQGKLH